MPTVHEDERKLFVGALPQEAKDSDIKEYFEAYGEIDSINLKVLLFLMSFFFYQFQIDFCRWIPSLADQEGSPLLFSRLWRASRLRSSRLPT